jgi:peptide/nickel transport system substrate-binding protein
VIVARGFVDPDVTVCLHPYHHFQKEGMMSKRSRTLVVTFVTIGLALSVSTFLAFAIDENVFTYATYQESMTCDPAKSVDETEVAIVLNAYDPLVYPVKGAAPKPWVAESWEVSESGLEYVFKIREGIKFHDGSDLTAEDVVFSMKRMLQINQGFSWLWNEILEPDDVEMTGTYEVTFHLNKLFGPFIATLVQFNVVNKDLLLANKKPGDYGEFGDFGQEYLETQDAGSGAYIVESVTLGDIVIFTKFDEYWHGWEPGQLDKVIWRVIPERATMDILLKKGDVDMIDQWGTPEEYEELAATEGVMVQEDPNVMLYLHQINNQRAPFDDINVRKAVCYAFDYETALRDIFHGAAQAEGPVPILLPGHSDNVTVYHQDLEKAREFLASSKYSAAELEDMELIYVYVTGNELERKLGLLMQSNFAEIGLKVTLEKAVWGRMCDMASKPETTPHFMAIYNGAKYPSPDMFTYTLFNPNAWGTFRSCSWYENEEVTELTATARKTIDTEERYALYMRAQEIITEDAAALFIANPIHRIAMRDYVKGYDFCGINPFDLVFYNLKLDK